MLISFFVLSSTALIRIFLFEPFFVRGEAMSPSYNDADYLFINKFDRHFNPGDVIIYEDSNQQFFMKRIIGLPGEKIEVKNERVLINDQIFNDPYYPASTISNPSTTTLLSEDHFFVMGDNRPFSADSRIFGPISRKEIRGKTLPLKISLGSVEK